MKKTSLISACLALGLHACLMLSNAHAQGGPEMAVATLSAQKDALATMAFMDGEWRGSAWTVGRDGNRHEITQTERIGPLLDGTIKLIEGRGYNADGSTGFNAFGVLSYEPSTKAWTLSSWAQGHRGDFALTPKPDGYVWSIPAGPNASIRYTAVIQGDTFREIGEYLAEGKPPRQTFEMNLTRVGPSTWPTAGALGPK